MSQAVLQPFAHVMSDVAGELSHQQEKASVVLCNLAPKLLPKMTSRGRYQVWIGGHMQNWRIEGIEK